MNLKHLQATFAAFVLSASASAAGPVFDDKFRQLDELLPTPGETRNAAGAPGHKYWQQRADYTIRATLGVRETETMTYLDIRNETYNWGTR